MQSNTGAIALTGLGCTRKCGQGTGCFSTSRRINVIIVEQRFPGVQSGRRWAQATPHPLAVDLVCLEHVRGEVEEERVDSECLLHVLHEVAKNYLRIVCARGEDVQRRAQRGGGVQDYDLRNARVERGGERRPRSAEGAGGGGGDGGGGRVDVEES